MKIALVISLILFISLWLPQPAQAQDVLGIHILHPYELADAKALLGNSDLEWDYVTIPLSLNDLDKQVEWQDFFDEAREMKAIPIVRLATTSENGVWKKPTREDTVKLLDFLNSLHWPTEQRHIIAYNEVNHAKEWGGEIQPVEYAQVLRFVGLWAKAQHRNFVVLPAAMDLAAPNGSQTREAFTYLNQMLDADPSVFSHIDYWNSHSYPNPGFSSAPTRTAQNSLRGYEHELSYLKRKTGRDYQVFITETGWAENATTISQLDSYYNYALKNIWSDPRIVTVTPFLLRGAPGPFAMFTFLDAAGQPTRQYQALQKAMADVKQATSSTEAAAAR